MASGFVKENRNTEIIVSRIRFVCILGHTMYYSYFEEQTHPRCIGNSLGMLDGWRSCRKRRYDMRNGGKEE